MQACVCVTPRDLTTYALVHITRHLSSTHVLFLKPMHRSKPPQNIPNWADVLAEVIAWGDRFGHPFSSCVYLKLALRSLLGTSEALAICWNTCWVSTGQLHVFQASFSLLWPEPMPGALSNRSLRGDGNLGDNYTDLTHHNASGSKKGLQGDITRGV